MAFFNSNNPGQRQFVMELKFLKLKFQKSCTLLNISQIVVKH